MTAKGGFRESVRGAFLDNVGLKVLSLLCALGIYAFIHGAENAERTVSVSIVTIMPPESANRQIMTQIPTEVKVTLRGTRTQLDDLRNDDLGTLNLNLRSGRETNIDLEPSMFRTPAGVSIAEIIPPSIEIRWDDVVTHSIPVQIARTGEPAQSFAIKGVRAEPANVQARGPRTIVDVLQYAQTAPFDVTGLTEGVYRRSLHLDKPQKLVTYDVDSVMATVEITRELSKKEFANLRVEVVGLTRAATTPPTVKVRLVGSNEDVNAITPESLVPRVEPVKTSGLDVTKPGSAYLDVLLDVNNLRVEINPPKVLVKW